MNNEVYFLELSFGCDNKSKFFVVGQQNSLFTSTLNEVLRSYNIYLSDIGSGGAVNCISVTIKTKDLGTNEWKRQVKLCTIYLLDSHILLSFNIKVHVDNFNPKYMYVYNVDGDEEKLCTEIESLTNCVIKNVARLFHSSESREYVTAQLDNDGCCTN